MARLGASRVSPRRLNQIEGLRFLVTWTLYLVGCRRHAPAPNDQRHFIWAMAYWHVLIMYLPFSGPFVQSMDTMRSVGSGATRILVADDQNAVIEALRLLLKGESFRVESVSSPAGVLEACKNTDFDLVLLDLNYSRDTTSGTEGLDLLSRLQLLDSTLPVVVMTAWGSIELAVEAMRRGARDFVQKPWENGRLLAIVKNQVELAKALRRSQKLEAENRILRGEPLTKLIAESPAMRPVLDIIDRTASADANVLVTGENGTGKGLIANVIHSVSARRSKAFLSVNIGGLSDTLFESELFGHVKGAFTDAKVDRVGRFEIADGGTLFLDEIGNVPLGKQAKLLRVLETSEFERLGSSKTLKTDVRIISATNAVLSDEVASGRFRQDLLFRLNTIEIRLPPLRERQEDIPNLAMHFLRTHTSNYGKAIKGFEPSALQALRNYPWPGNVRQLDHAILRAVLMARGNQILSSELGLEEVAETSFRLEDLSLEDVEAFLIKKALARYEGNVLKAAEALGLSRSAFYRRIDKYGL